MIKASLYYHTVKDMKLSQIVNRLLIKMGGGCTLGVVPSDNYTNIELVNSPQEIDFDPVFLEHRFEDKMAISGENAAVEFQFALF